MALGRATHSAVKGNGEEECLRPPAVYGMNRKMIAWSKASLTVFIWKIEERERQLDLGQRFISKLHNHFLVPFTLEMVI